MAPYVFFFFPWTRKAGEEKDFFLPLSPPSFPLKRRRHNPHFPCVGGRPSPIFVYKNRGRVEEKKEREQNERGEERGEHKRANKVGEIEREKTKLKEKEEEHK
jgi:hypothetical protein